MAEKKKRRPAGRAPRTRTLTEMFRQRKNRNLNEFKPDVNTATWFKTRRLTRQQRLRLTRWGMYILILLMSLVIQDVVMSQIRLFGATTDLPAAAILLITVVEGTDVGSLFVLIASTLYFYSGTAPGAYCIGLLSAFGIFATMLRQMYWHRSRGSLTACAMLALICYEMALFVVGVSMGLTYWGRLPIFILTAAYTCLVMIPMYSLVNRAGLIGGYTWKE